MSTSMLVDPNDPTVFPYISEEELAHPVQPFITDEEFNAFLLSVSPHTTEFNVLNDSIFPLDANATLDEIFALTNQNLSEISADVQPSLDPDFLVTPKDFILECGLDPADFKSLQAPSPSGDSDTWNFVLQEMLDKMTEWVKTTDISLTEMGAGVEDLQQYGLLDEQLSI